MGLDGFFFYGHPNYTFLQDLATSQRMNAVREKWRRRKDRATDSRHVDERVATLEKDLGYVTLVLGAVLDCLNHKGVVTREDVRTTLQTLDEVDGVRDGSLDVGFLRELEN